MVTRLGSPPRPRCFSAPTGAPRSGQAGRNYRKPDIRLPGEFRVRQETKHADTIIDRHHDQPFARQRLAVVKRHRGGTARECAAVDPYKNGPLAGGLFGPRSRRSGRGNPRCNRPGACTLRSTGRETARRPGYKRRRTGRLGACPAMPRRASEAATEDRRVEAPRRGFPCRPSLRDRKRERRPQSLSRRERARQQPPKTRGNTGRDRLPEYAPAAKGYSNLARTIKRKPRNQFTPMRASIHVLPIDTRHRVRRSGPGTRTDGLPRRAA